MSRDGITTFYIDRCLGSKTIVETLREKGITVEIHDDHFSQNAPDTEWIPEVGRRGWIVLTKDAKIAKNFLERIAVANSGVKMFILVSQGLSGQEMANIFVEAIEEMRKKIRNNSAPFIAKVYRDGKVKIWMDSEDLLAELDKLPKL